MIRCVKEYVKVASQKEKWKMEFSKVRNFVSISSWQIEDRERYVAQLKKTKMSLEISKLAPHFATSLKHNFCVKQSSIRRTIWKSFHVNQSV